MKLSDFEIAPEQFAGLERLLGKLSAGTAQSRDSSDLCRRTFGITVKAGSINEAQRSVRVVASTDAIDSYDEIVQQDWDLRRYDANPVVLYSHNAVGLCGPAEDTLPIGFSSDVGVVGGQLEATLHFVKADAAPMAEKVWQGFRQGSIRAVSVGFRPHDVREEVRDDKPITVLARNELFEISACPIPANPEAVARSAERNRAQAIRLAHRNSHPAAAGPPEEEDPMKEELDKAKAALEAKTAELDKFKAESVAREAKLTEDLEKAKKAEIEAAERADKAEAQVAKLEVDALVGKKIAPAEVNEFLELRTTNPTLFKKMVEKRADISSLTKDVIGDDDDPKNKAADGADVAAGEDLTAAADRRARGLS